MYRVKSHSVLNGEYVSINSGNTYVQNGILGVARKGRSMHAHVYGQIGMVFCLFIPCWGLWELVMFVWEWVRVGHSSDAW